LGCEGLESNVSNACDDLANKFAVIDLKAFAAGDFDLAGIEAGLMENGRVNVGDVMALFDGVTRGCPSQRGREHR
jgi:hypothetical protein